jgi:endonuclease G
MARRPSKKSARKQPAARPANPEGVSTDDLKRFIRSKGARYLESANINSIGIGIKKSDNKSKDGKLCIQFTVDQKVAPERLESVGTRHIPESFTINGQPVLTDILQRTFTPSLRIIPENVAVKDPRKRRQEALQPGLSIAHVRESAGTIGAIVYDRDTGAPLVLSNWHVLHSDAGRIGDTVVQPGPFDDNHAEANACGKLLRSHLGVAGDCAVASIEGRAVQPAILKLNVIPARIAKVDIGDRVVKSGRTTDVTYGVVTRIEVITKLDYGRGDVTIGGFEIGYDEARKPGDGEITKGGDSGSAWMALDPATSKPSDIIVGLHFAGETGDAPEMALACNIHSVLEKLNVTVAPPAGSAAAASLAVAGPRAEASSRFGGAGYDDGFLSERLRLPTPTQRIARDLAGANAKRFADYTHFSLTMNQRRRLAAFVAWNIDASRSLVINSSGNWRTDARVPDDAQMNNRLYENTRLDRGHVAKREDLVWGSSAEAKKAGEDSYCYTNCAPMHENFNRQAPALWKSLEDEIFRQAKPRKLRLSVFAGPIFRTDDREFVASGAPSGTPKIKLPRDFFKIVAYDDPASGRLKVHAFILSQAQLIRGRLEALEPQDLAAESLDLAKYRMHQKTVADVGRLIGFAMPDLERFDTMRQAPERVGLESFGAADEVQSFADIV